MKALPPPPQPHHRGCMKPLSTMATPQGVDETITTTTTATPQGVDETISTTTSTPQGVDETITITADTPQGVDETITTTAAAPQGGISRGDECVATTTATRQGRGDEIVTTTTATLNRGRNHWGGSGGVVRPRTRHIWRRDSRNALWARVQYMVHGYMYCRGLNNYQYKSPTSLT